MSPSTPASLDHALARLAVDEHRAARRPCDPLRASWLRHSRARLLALLNATS